MKNSLIIQDLEKKILHHKELYYQGKAEISDEAYDNLEEELRKLDPDNPVLQLVGFTQSESPNKVKHDKKMLSLEKTYEEKDLIRWIGKQDVLSIFKIDGSSCSLIYENGHLVMAKTRGDGQVGENIHKKTIFIQDVPKYIPGNASFEIRGEVFCVEENFFELSREMQKLGLATPTSQRNIVAGLLGRKENIQLCRFLNFQAFDIISTHSFKKEHEKLEFLKKVGLQTPEYVLHHGKQDLKQRIQEAKDFMGNGDYLIDGLVFVYDDLTLHDELGETAHHPRYKIAFKFEGETKTAKILKIQWGVSRNGTLTPVAIIEPTELSGATISRVTLHNFGLVKNFKLKAGDLIEVIRSGEVIPKFLGVVEKQPGDFSYPANCPSCGSELVIEDIWLCCENDLCPAKIKEEILNYIQKAGIDDLSDKRLEEMIKKGLINKISDLYRLKVEDFLTLEKVKEKLATKLYENIQKSKEQPLSQFISAIGIEGISVTKSEKIIAEGYNTLEKFLNIRFEDLLQVEGFAEKSSNSILNSLKKKAPLIKELNEVGVKVKREEAHLRSGPLLGLKFCITGELSRPRSEIEKIIKHNGGSISGVSKNLNFLVTNEKESSSSKFTKAKALNIPIIDEKELNEMIEG